MQPGFETLQRIVGNVERSVIGKRRCIELCLITLLCGGHVLVEDVPGVGKTLLASSLARSVDASFRRIQFTPDVLPSDITGFSIYNQKSGEFEFKPGAIMSQMVLADEINRTSPKTQASLLEVMEEGQATVDGTTYRLPTPFMLMATQNPIEYLGTFPLPEAQLDRFFMKISIGYPSFDDEADIVRRYGGGPEDALPPPVASGAEITEIQGLVDKVHFDDSLARYVVRVANATRDHREIALGASPRASIALYKASKAWAFYSGRDFVVPDDVKAMAPHVLNHRIMLRQEAKLRKLSAADIVDGILGSVPIPVVGQYAAK